TPHVPPPDIDRDLVVEVAPLAPDHGRTGAEADVRYLTQRDLGPVGLADEDPRDRLGIVPEIPSVAHLDRVALPAFDGGGDLLAPQRETDHLLRVTGRQAVARESIGVGPDVQIAPAERTLGVDTGGAGERREHAFDILADPLNGLEVGTEDLHRQRRPRAGRQ